MNSIWSETVELPKFKRLQENVSTDVLIIGGGIAGILCAYFLGQQGVDYILAEGSTICNGVTKNTTAKITSQHGLIYDKLLKSKGAELAKMYLEANHKALESYTSLCKNIDCDFEQKSAYVYSLDNRRKLEKEAEALYKIGFNARITESCQLPFSTAGALCFDNQAQFNPLKFIAQISKGLNIYEHTFVKELTDTVAVTENGNISYQRIIFATHFPIDNKHGMYFLKMYQHRSYVIALENAAKIDGMSLDGIPYIGQYSKGLPNCYVATGFNKWGMTSSMVAAMILVDMITGKENPYAPVFSPSRNMLKPQLLINACESTINLLTISKKRCPHLGCVLKWNATEHSWDCPCHGSRFDKNGKVLDNPANGDMKKN